MDEQNVVRCAGCRRVMGFSKKPTALRNQIFCDEWCLNEVPAAPQEERNDHWRALVALGWSPVAVARRYDVPHSLVYKTLSRG